MSQTEQDIDKAIEKAQADARRVGGIVSQHTLGGATLIVGNALGFLLLAAHRMGKDETAPAEVLKAVQELATRFVKSNATGATLQ